jgi:hypothetical protein
MSQPTFYLDKDDPAVRGVLNRLWEFQALTYEQIAQLEFGGDKRKTYDRLRRLYENGYIMSHRSPANHRIAYAVLTSKAVREIHGSTGAWAPPRKDRVERLLSMNDLYLRLLAAGIAPEAISRRREVLRDLDVMPSYTRVAAQVAGKDKSWLLYVREDGFRKALLKSTHAVSSDLGHVVFYEGSPAKDIRVFLEQSVPQSFHCLRMDDLPVFKTLAFEPEKLVRRMEEHIAPHLGGRVVRLENSPFETAWERPDGKRMILADLSTNNLGPVAATRNLSIEYAAHPNVNWGQGVLIFASDEKSAKMWHGIIGHKEWLWLIRYDLPPGSSLFKSGERSWVPHRG